MLLSMFISFLLARRFKEKVYVLLMILVLILVSLLSIGFPSLWGTLEEDYFHRRGITTVWKVNLPAIPLSFPFYASILETYPYMSFPRPAVPIPHFYSIQLHFLTFQVWTNKIGWIDLLLTSQDIVILVSFFLLANLAGAILGYLISKTTFIERYFARRKPRTLNVRNEEKL